MGSISQRSCHAYLPSVKYTTAQKSGITAMRKRKGEKRREREMGREKGKRNDFKEIMREKQTKRCNVKLRLSDSRLLNVFRTLITSL